MTHDSWDAIITGGRRDALGSAARAGLRAAAGLYGLGLAANHWIYDSGLRDRTGAPIPVISIGNLTLGGTGKTTSAAYVARLLIDAAKPGIVLRGYRRAKSQGPLIVSDGDRILAGLDQSGDEALMLSNALPGCAVAVGKRREQVIEALATRAGAQVAILDDGLQYFRMRRDLEIVLVDALADDAALNLFPAGRLREPLASLTRAHQVWITHSDLVPRSRLGALQTVIREHCPEGLIAHARHRPGALRSLDDRPVPDTVDGLRVLAFSGLGNPDAFEQSLARMGASLRSIRFPDHHSYSPEDLTLVASRGQAVGADLIVTTAKDAVKLPRFAPGGIPGAVLECDLELTSGDRDVAEQVMGILHV